MDIDRVLLTLAAENHSLVHRRRIAQAGVSNGQWQRRVARGDWIKMNADVYRHVLAVDTWRLRARAGLMHLGREAALFGHSCAAWWGLDVPEPSEAAFVVPRSRRRLDPSLEIHTTERWERGQLLHCDGARLTSPTRAIIDMASCGFGARVLENAIDSSIRKSMTSLPTFTAAIHRLGGRGRAHIVLIKALLLDSGGESFLERRFLRLVRRNGFPRPTCQVVHRSASKRIVRVDFQFPGTNVVVEVSGRLGHVSDRERQKDARRRNQLQGEGFVFIEFTTADVLDDEAYVLRTLGRWVSPRPCRA